MAGRPEKPIDWTKFEELCHIQCTHEELASMCKVAKSTLYERAEKHYGEEFPTLYKKLSEGGKCSLRRVQFKLANKNTAMAIWLGKQYLGQKDQPEQANVKPEDIEKFTAIMNLLSQNQSGKSAKSDLNIASNNINNADKS